jgi:hypothetical protein
MPPSTTLITLSGKFSERRSQLDYYMIQKAIEDQQEIEKLEQPFKVEQEISSDQQLKSTMALEEERDSHSFWPDGIESWHIHEIKPQRNIFARIIVTEVIVTVQHRLIERQPEISEKLSDSQTDSLFDGTVRRFDDANTLQSLHISEPSINQFKPEEKISQNATKLIQLIPSVTLVNEQQQGSYEQILEMTTAQRRLKPPRNSLHSNQKPRLYDLLHVFNVSIRSSSHNRSFNNLLGFIATWVIQWSLFLCSILLRIGITNKLPNLSDNVYDQLPNFNVDFLSTMSTGGPGEFLKKTLSYSKTIKILRDLESLLIYAII